MNDFLFINLCGRLLLVVSPVVAFRFARHRSLKSWQSLLLCTAAAVFSNVLLAVSVAVTGVSWFSSPGAFVSALARSAVYYAACGLAFGAVCLWRRVASTSRLFLIALVIVAAVDLSHIVVDPMLGLPANEARPVMLVLALVLGSLIYAWSPGAERQLPVAGASRGSHGTEL